MTQRFTALAITALSVAASASCSKKDKGGSALGLGQLHIPLKDTAPTGLASASAVSSNLTGQLAFFENPQSAENSASPMSTIKERLFQEGPTDFMNRIKKVDERLAELDSRHQDTARTCVSEAAKEWTISGLPDANGGLTASATFWFQCVEEMSGDSSASLKVYFGRKDGFSYLAELQTATGGIPTMAVLGVVDDASTKSEIWQVNIADASVTDDAKKHSSWMRILADKTSETFEMAVGGTGTMGKTANGGEEPFSGLGCGVRVKANSTRIYGSGRFYDANSNPDTNPVCQAAATTVCASASDLSVVADDDCSGLTSFAAGLPTLTYSQLKGSATVPAGYTLGQSIISATGAPSLTSFNTQD